MASRHDEDSECRWSVPVAQGLGRSGFIPDGWSCSTLSQTRTRINRRIFPSQWLPPIGPFRFSLSTPRLKISARVNSHFK